MPGSRGRFARVRRPYPRLGARVEAVAVGLGGSGSLVFVAAGAVEPWHWNAKQTIVNRELPAMMNQMVHHHAANTADTWHDENGLATGLERPIFHHVRAAGAGKRRPSFRSFFVKNVQSLLPILHLRRLKRWSVHRCVIEFLSINGHSGPPRERGDVRDIPANGTGLVVGLPIPLLIGNALE